MLAEQSPIRIHAARESDSEPPQSNTDRTHEPIQPSAVQSPGAQPSGAAGIRSLGHWWQAGLLLAVLGGAFIGGAMARSGVERLWWSKSAEANALGLQAHPTAALGAVVDPAAARQLETAIQRLDARMGRLALVAMATSLEAATRRSGAFFGELALAMRLADDDRYLLEPLDAMMAVAESGVAAETDIVAEFPAVEARARLLAARADGSFAERATLAMRDVALTMGIGELPESAPSILLDRARAAFEARSIDEAASILSRLQGPTAAAVAPWLAMVSARRQLDEDVDRFKRLAIERAFADATEG